MELPLAVVLSSIALCSTAAAQVTQRVSVGSNGTQGNNGSGYSAITPDGRYVAFWSVATDLVSGDTNGVKDIFVRDRQLGLTERVSVDSAGAQGDGGSDFPSISADGRYVSFMSHATNLVSGDTDGFPDIFVRDRQSGTTERVSVDSSGAQGDLPSYTSSISADGRYVAFWSLASNFVPGDSNTAADVFVRDRQSGTTARVSVNSAGGQGNAGSVDPSISADGRYVAFSSYATNLVPGDTNGTNDVLVRDRQSGTTERVSVDSAGAEANQSSGGSAITPDGRYVAFVSYADNLVGGDTNTFRDVFVRDRVSGTTERVSVSSTGVQGNSGSDGMAISSGGRYVAFGSTAANLVSGDTNGLYDIFVRDRQAGTTERVSVDSTGAQANGLSSFPSISADGRFVAFACIATSLVPADTNGVSDVFVRDRLGGPDFTSLCDPGSGGVMACPCANPPSGPGRGCDNSSATGGAILSASGGTYLSSDSLVLTTSGERPTSLSIVAQWVGYNATGVAFGMGVRCTSGTFKRLFSRNAVGGSITVPNFAGGDASVSAQSAAKGDPILAGQSRWYVVYYRDPNVLGGCPATSNFNATQTGQVSWSP